MVDKNLFLYDLAVVAILKNEGAYLKEWLDYHLLAGVEHFYLYDNDSTDNQAKVVAPYVKAGLVDYLSAPGKAMQYAAYNDAVKRFKFRCRYMAFIDGDEFIFPKTNHGITEVVDEILSCNANARGLAINWQIFGSNGQETADYSRGVLERFTRRAPTDWAPDKKGNAHVKNLANPRAINLIGHPHFPYYFEGFYSVNENGAIVPEWRNLPVTAEKIAINHYFTKSKAEYEQVKMLRGWSCENKNPYVAAYFELHDRNEEFDDGILKYRGERAKTFQPPDKSRVNERLLNALMVNLSPALLPNTPPKFYAGKMETFLTCRAVAAYLKPKLADAELAKSFEEAALKAVLRSIFGMSFTDARLFIRELPNILNLPYAVTKELRAAAMKTIPQMMNIFHLNNMWKDYIELDYLRELLIHGG